MNVLLLICIAITAGLALLGWHQGLVKMVFHMLSFAAALILAVIIGPIIADFVLSQETVMDKVTEHTYETLNLSKLESAEMAAKQDIEALKLPETIREQLISENTKEVYEDMKAANAAEYISKTVAAIVVRAACLVITFIVLLIILFILANALNLIAKLPVLNTINKSGGLVIGLLQAALVLMILFALITAFGNTGLGKSCLQMIDESEILTFLYSRNILNHAIVEAAVKFK